MVLFAMYQFEKQNILCFLVADRLQKLIVENESKAEERKIQQMREMIGNVAHDLKTPLASFLSGIDTILNSVMEIKSSLHSKDYSVDTAVSSLDSILSTLSNINSVSRFMTMAMNRCMDYTKVSNGMALRPHLETINLKEALGMPLSCIHDMREPGQEEQLLIKLDPMFPLDTICSHIITDKQWLQENMLCVLSNSVKYTFEGLVLVRTFLTTDHCINSNGERTAEQALRFEVEGVFT
jgi:signal transduction histidine kinase